MPDALKAAFWLDYYRDKIENFIADQKRTPLAILEKLLDVYISRNAKDARPFAYTFKNGLAQENYPVLDEIEKHLKQNKTNKDEFYIALAAYFYYYQDYYQLTDQTDKTRHKHLHKQLLYPLRLLQQQQQDQVLAKMKNMEKYNYYMFVHDLIASDPNRYSDRFVPDLIQQIPNGDAFLFYTKHILRALSVANLSMESFSALANALALKTMNLDELVPLVEKIIHKQLLGHPNEKQLSSLLESPCTYICLAASNIILKSQILCETTFSIYQFMALTNHSFYAVQKMGYALLAAKLFIHPHMNALGLGRLVDILGAVESADWQKQEILTLLGESDLPRGIVARLTPILAVLCQNGNPIIAKMASLHIIRWGKDDSLTREVINQLKQTPCLVSGDITILTALRLPPADCMLFIEKILEAHLSTKEDYACIAHLCQDDAVREWCMQKIFHLLVQTRVADWYKGLRILKVLSVPEQHFERVLLILKEFLCEAVDSRKPLYACETLREMSLPTNALANIIDQLFLLTNSTDNITGGAAYEVCIHFASLIQNDKINYIQILNHLAGDSLIRTEALTFLLQVKIPEEMHFHLLISLLANFKTIYHKEKVCELFIKYPLPAYNQAIIKCLFSDITIQTPTIKKAYYNVIAHMHLTSDEIHLLVEKARFLCKVSVLDDALLALLYKQPLNRRQEEDLLSDLFEKLPKLTFHVQRMFFKYINYFSEHLFFEQKTFYLIKLADMARNSDEPGLWYLYEDYRQKQFICFQLENEIDQQLQPHLPPEVWQHCNNYLYRP